MISILVLTCFVIAVIALLSQKKEKLKHIPGPKGIPLFGNVFQMDLKNVHKWITEQMKIYGSVIKISLLNTNIVVVSGREEIHQVLVTKGNDFSGRPYAFRAREAYTNSFVSHDYTASVREAKKILMNYMKVYGEGIKHVEEIILTAVGNLIKELQSQSSEKQIDIKSVIRKTLIDMIYVLEFHCSASQKEIVQIAKMTELNEDVFGISGEGTLLDMFPWIRYIKSPTYEKFNQLNQMEKTLFTEWKEMHMNSKGTSKTLIEYYYQHNISKPTLAFDDEKISRNLHLLFLAGTSTSTVTLSSLINRLVHDCDLQRKLYEESKRILNGKEVSLSDKENLPLHEATVIEASRYYSILPFMVPHKTVKDTSINDVKIPKGTQVWINMYAYSHDESIWGDPFNFRPERFLNRDGNLDENGRKMSFYFFGAGPRVCPGEVFAKMRLFLILVSLVQKFEFLPATTIEEQTSCDVKDALIGTFLSSGDFKIRLRQRTN